MSENTKDTGDSGGADDANSDLSRFPHSRKLTSATLGSFKDLGITPLVRQLGLDSEQTNGHWCSRCQGIWFGYTLEVECPVCGNRSG